MSTIIRTRSPYFIRTPQEADATLNYFQINITIKGGVLGVASCPVNLGTYSLQKKPLGTENSVSFDISEIVNDFIEQRFINNTPLTGYNVSADTQSVWVTVVTSARTSTGVIIGSGTTTNYLAQEGYNDFKEGVNYTVEPEAMISGSYIQYKKGDYIFLPVNAEKVTSVVFMYNGSVISTYNVSDNGNANQKINYAYYQTTTQEINIIRYEVAGVAYTINVQEVEECKYPVHKIVFLNRWGAFQDLYFFKKSTENLESKSENYNASIFEARSVSYSNRQNVCTEDIAYNVYDSNAHSKKTFNANATESISLNTGFVSESMNPYFEELMVSEYVWLVDSNNIVYPVNLKESSFAKKTGLNEGLINYTMNFEKSFSLVNNIR